MCPKADLIHHGSPGTKEMSALRHVTFKTEPHTETQTRQQTKTTGKSAISRCGEFQFYWEGLRKGREGKGTGGGVLQ